MQTVNRMSKKKIAIKFLLLLVFAVSFINQRSTGQEIQADRYKSLRGKITDKETGAPVPGVTVYITDLKTGGISDKDGNYLINQLPARSVMVRVSCIGYRTIIETVDLNVADTLDFAVSEAVAEIGEVVVTGLSVASELQRTPAPVTTVPGIKLRESVASNVIDALSMTPGVSQVSTGPAVSKPVIRGLGYNRVVVVNDGVRQEGQQWGDEHGIELDEYTVGEVEILKGPASLSYGSDALAGVLHFLSQPVLPEGSLQAELLLNYQTNHGLIGTSANASGNLDGNVWDIRISRKAAHDYQNRYDDYVWNTRFRELAATGMAGINRSWGYTHLHLGWYMLEPGIAEGDRDSLTGAFVKAEAETDSTVTYNLVPSDELKSYTPGIPRQQIDHFKAVLNAHVFAGTGSVKAIAGWQQNIRREFDDVHSPDDYGLRFDLNTFNYDVRYLLPERRGMNISFGVNGMSQSSENKGTEFLIPGYSLFDAGIFAIVSQSLDRFDISGGLRYDLRTQEAESLFLGADGVPVSGGTPGAEVKFSGFDRNFKGWSGSAGATMKLSDDFFAKLNFARGWRAPNIAELGSNGEHEGTGRYEYGNSNLDPEQIVQGDFTLGCHTEHVHGEINLFANLIQDYIYVSKMAAYNGNDSLVDGIPVFEYQSGNASLWGGEISFDIHPHPLDWLHFETTFSMVTGELKNQPDSSKYLPFIPAPKLVSELKAKRKKLGSFMENAYVGAGIVYQSGQDKVYLVNGTETPTDAYLLIHAGAGTDIVVKKKKVASLYVGATNLADVAYQDHLSRLKYAPENYKTGRTGIYGMGRNVSFRLILPFSWKQSR